ncbi:hypothetical protein V6N12_002878 [Hibiscus sabdariffa]|uniref:Uncharacterized protein n=1 Tax=Hibiscus sabdariffa TaxID=183260 RepID=A0ABR2EA94_9ROSI
MGVASSSFESAVIHVVPDLSKQIIAAAPCVDDVSPVAAAPRVEDSIQAAAPRISSSPNAHSSLAQSESQDIAISINEDDVRMANVAAIFVTSAHQHHVSIQSEYSQIQLSVQSDPRDTLQSSPNKGNNGRQENGELVDKDDHLYLWLPLLAGLSKLGFDPIPEIRESALQVLFETLRNYSHLFSRYLYGKKYLNPSFFRYSNTCAMLLIHQVMAFLSRELMVT